VGQGCRGVCRGDHQGDSCPGVVHHRGHLPSSRAWDRGPWTAWAGDSEAGVLQSSLSGGHEAGQPQSSQSGGSKAGEITAADREAARQAHAKAAQEEAVRQRHARAAIEEAARAGSRERARQASPLRALGSLSVLQRRFSMPQKQKPTPASPHGPHAGPAPPTPHAPHAPHGPETPHQHQQQQQKGASGLPETIRTPPVLPGAQGTTGTTGDPQKRRASPAIQPQVLVRTQAQQTGTAGGQPSPRAQGGPTAAEFQGSQLPVNGGRHPVNRGQTWTRGLFPPPAFPAPIGIGPRAANPSSPPTAHQAGSSRRPIIQGRLS